MYSPNKGQRPWKTSTRAKMDADRRSKSISIVVGLNVVSNPIKRRQKYNLCRYLYSTCSFELQNGISNGSILYPKQGIFQGNYLIYDPHFTILSKPLYYKCIKLQSKIKTAEIGNAILYTTLLCSLLLTSSSLAYVP